MSVTGVPTAGPIRCGTAGARVDIQAPEVQAVLTHMLASRCFAKSQRLSRLLRFVVEKAVAGETRQLNEYAIGLEVFDRDAATYSPGDDPIVRVQIGRLRDKLQDYYAKEADDQGIRFDIPLGSYIPIIQRVPACVDERVRSRRLMILPISGIAVDTAGEQFAQGLREELIHHLFRDLGEIVMPSAPSQPTGASRGDARAVIKQGGSDGAGYLLEGSIRIEGLHVRVSLRLVDAGSGGVAWSEQFDSRIEGTIATQEALASTICKELKRFCGAGGQAVGGVPGSA